EGRRVDDLVRGAPELGEVADHRRISGDAHRLPGGHHLVHPASVEIRARVAPEVVDEAVDLLVRMRPVEASARVRDAAVDRGDRRVDQPPHAPKLQPYEPPAAIIAIPISATTTPICCGRARRSPRMTRASSTVTAEYIEPATATSGSSPKFADTA